jgi:hypothetical protein
MWHARVCPPDSRQWRSSGLLTCGVPPPPLSLHPTPNPQPPITTPVRLPSCPCAPGGKFLTSGAYLGQPRTLLWADAAETVPLQALKLAHWGFTAAQVELLAITHTSITSLNLKVWSNLKEGGRPANVLCAQGHAILGQV